MSHISYTLTVKSIGISYMYFYDRWMESTWIDNNGLCNSLPEKNLVHLFRPDNAGKYEYWAYDGDSTSIFERAQRFTPLRQNIVLFMAAMNNEL